VPRPRRSLRPRSDGDAAGRLRSPDPRPRSPSQKTQQHAALPPPRPQPMWPPQQLRDLHVASTESDAGLTPGNSREYQDFSPVAQTKMPHNNATQKQHHDCHCHFQARPGTSSQASAPPVDIGHVQRGARNRSPQAQPPLAGHYLLLRKDPWLPLERHRSDVNSLH